MSEPLKIAIAGLGTVGTGTLQLLLRQADLLAARCARRLQVIAVADLDCARDRGVDMKGIECFNDALKMIESAKPDVLVELIGGAEGIARTLCEKALDRGIGVVTANKALLAHHGLSLARRAEEKNVVLAYEASVAGGIPIIKALREGFVGNRITRVAGILNGTCNYILTTMRESGREFGDVLAEAQKLGYAEADPSFDVDGVDTAHKLSILTAVAFGAGINFKGVYVEGIRGISALDISFADELGYRIKLLGIARRVDGGVEQRVHPSLIPLATSLAHVDGVFNAVAVEGDFVGKASFVGRGAGDHPTASAVVADICDIARGIRIPVFGIPVKSLSSIPTVPMESHKGAYYLRFKVSDKPGVIADISAILKDYEISMESMIQHGRAERSGGAVNVVMTTHQTSEAAMTQALAGIGKLSSMVEPPHRIRIES